MAFGGDNGSVVGDRLVLEMLRVEHALEMRVLLNDPALYVFTGGEPLSLTELRARYAAQVARRSPDGMQCWLNWIARLRATGAAIGYVQATVTGDRNQMIAEVAWVIGTRYQGQGFALEAAQMMLQALQTRGVRTIQAHIHPDHRASNAIATRIGLSPTGFLIDREMRWQTGGEPVSPAPLREQS